MTIGKKISIACATLVALTVLSGVLSIAKIGQIHDYVRHLVTDFLPGLTSMSRVTQYAKDQRQSMMLHMLAETPDQMSEAEAAIADLGSKFDRELRRPSSPLATATCSSG